MQISEKTELCPIQAYVTFLKFENKGTYYRTVPDLHFPNRTFLGVRKEKVFLFTLRFSIWGSTN